MSITILGCQWGTLGPALCIPTIISSPAAAKYKYKIQHLSSGPCKPHLSCGEQHQDWRGHGVTAKAGWMRGGAMAHTSMLCTKDWHGLKSSADCLQPRLENKLECTVHSYTCVQNESRKWPKSPSCGHKEGWQQNSKCNLFFYLHSLRPWLMRNNTSQGTLTVVETKDYTCTTCIYWNWGNLF